MSDLNRFIVTGRLTRDAQLQTTPNGLEMARFSIANNRSKKNQDGTWGEVVNFFDLALYGERAKKTAPYLVKGLQVTIEAHIAQKRWEKDGKKFQRLEIVIDDLKFAGRYPKSNVQNEVAIEESEPVTEEDLPPVFDEGDF